MPSCVAVRKVAYYCISQTLFSGKAIQEAQAKAHEEEMIRAAEERRKQKAEDKIHLQRIREQMKADRFYLDSFHRTFRAEKQANFQARKEGDEKAFQEKLQKQREQQEAQAAALRLIALFLKEIFSNSARILFRFAGSSTTTTQTFDADAQLMSLVNFIDQEHPCGDFSMSQQYPKRDFTSADMNKSLRDLLLPPSATILVKPVGRAIDYLDDKGRRQTRRSVKQHAERDSEPKSKSANSLASLAAVRCSDVVVRLANDAQD